MTIWSAGFNRPAESGRCKDGVSTSTLVSPLRLEGLSCRCAHEYSFLGIHVQPLQRLELLQLIADAIAAGERRVIANHNLHSLYLVHHQARMREFHDIADHTHVDGMSVVLLGRLFGAPLARQHRTGYMDFLPHLARAAVQERWRLFHLGSRPGVADRAASLLKTQYPGLQIHTSHGHFDARQDSAENRAVLQEIADYQPHVLLVGMGMPRQETWILENLENIPAQAILCTGGLMDFVAGEVPTPPRWLGQIGLEWLYRLASEPRRLWRRYLVEPWFIAGLVARHLAMVSDAPARTAARQLTIPLTELKKLPTPAPAGAASPTKQEPAF
jgi:N-acetylglucosaminyldiphosphoundecaprenol N-acetyl-beta-D-mannosaminyltransferase